MASANTASTNGAPAGPDEHELKDMLAKAPLPVEEDIMQLARLGEIDAMQKLFQSGRYSADYRDEQGITPLHVRTSF
jgi:palmitoyltransferase ZDHHC13/17